MPGGRRDARAHPRPHRPVAPRSPEGGGGAPGVRGHHAAPRGSSQVRAALWGRGSVAGGAVSCLRRPILETGRTRKAEAGRDLRPGGCFFSFLFFPFFFLRSSLEVFLPSSFGGAEQRRLRAVGPIPWEMRGGAGPSWGVGGGEARGQQQACVWHEGTQVHAHAHRCTRRYTGVHTHTHTQVHAPSLHTWHCTHPGQRPMHGDPPPTHTQPRSPPQAQLPAPQVYSPAQQVTLKCN